MRKLFFMFVTLIFILSGSILFGYSVKSKVVLKEYYLGKINVKIVCLEGFKFVIVSKGNNVHVRQMMKKYDSFLKDSSDSSVPITCKVKD